MAVTYSYSLSADFVVANICCVRTCTDEITSAAIAPALLDITVGPQSDPFLSADDVDIVL